MNHRTGFTLIELLLVVVVIGLLAAIAIPKYSNVRDDSIMASVHSDLKNLASLQEMYQGSNLNYASDPADIAAFYQTEGVTIEVHEATGTGWAATAIHSALPSRVCGIYYGSASAANAGPATIPGVVTCLP